MNRKQADISVNLPTALLELEGEARSLLGKSVSRGRVAAKVGLSHAEGVDNRLLFDEGLARQYVAAVKRIAEESGVDASLTAADLFRAPGVFASTSRERIRKKSAARCSRRWDRPLRSS